MKLTINDIKIATQICHSNNVTIFFVDEKTYSAVDVFSRSIILSINNMNTKERFYSAVFHELAHIECYEEGLYERYHTDAGQLECSFEYMKRISLKAERFVDNLGKKNMNCYFPILKHEEAYGTKIEIDFLNKWVLDNY